MLKFVSYSAIKNTFQRQNLDSIEPEDFEDTLEEQPTVVVLKPGDLTAEEAAEINKQRNEGQFKTHGYNCMQSYEQYLMMNYKH